MTLPGTGEVNAAAFERYRIAHAVPAMGAELTPDTIPAEAGQWLIDASVSFTKGCYTGQELVARIDSRGGNVPRPIRLLRVDGEQVPVVGGEVRSAGAILGHVTSATPWLAPHQPALALGPIARSVEIGAVVEVQTESGAAVATVIEPPFVGDADH
jgi:folate-binding protein YgfZ